jgi:hypothetical protein
VNGHGGLATRAAGRRSIGPRRLAGPIAAALVVAATGALAAGDRLRLLDLDGRPVDPLASGGGRGVVAIFTATDCPISNRYAPEVRRLYERYAPRGVTFWLVYPNRSATPDAIRAHVEAYGYPVAALRDPTHALVKLTRAEVTPTAAVFDATGRLIYRGRIDDWYVAFGRQRRAPTTRDLADALDALLAGRPVAVPETPAIGCYITEG